MRPLKPFGRHGLLKIEQDCQRNLWPRKVLSNTFYLLLLTSGQNGLPHVKQILLVYNHKSTITMKRYAYIIGVIHSVVTLTWPGYLHSLIWNLNAILLIQIFWNGEDRIRTPAWKRMNSKHSKTKIFPYQIVWMGRPITSFLTYIEYVVMVTT